MVDWEFDTFIRTAQTIWWVWHETFCQILVTIYTDCRFIPAQEHNVCRDCSLSLTTPIQKVSRADVGL